MVTPRIRGGCATVAAAGAVVIAVALAPGSGATLAPASTSPPPAPPGGSGGSTAKYTATGAYTLASGSATKTGAISSAKDDQSGVLVKKSASLKLAGARVTTSGNSKSADESSFYGLNAGVLAQNGGRISITRGSVKTTGSGANGVFAYGSGTAITLSRVTIDATGEYAHGIMASGGGAITASDLTVSTAGGSSAAVATDRGGGTIVVNGGVFRSSGKNSPGIYSTGKIVATGAHFVSSGSEVVVIEGANSVRLVSDALTSTKAGKWGVMIYQSMSGDASGAKGVYTEIGGSLTDSAPGSPLFHVTNTTASISLKGVKVAAASGVLVKAAAAQWGTSGANGGTAVLTADAQSLAGALVADRISSISLTLRNRSTLTGTINATGAAKSASLALDASSTWKTTGNSHLTSLTGAKISGAKITNISGGGHTVTYARRAAADSYLAGKTYSLKDGGKLVAH